jgi:hypothetical protein
MKRKKRGGRPLAVSIPMPKTGWDRIAQLPAGFGVFDFILPIPQEEPEPQGINVPYIRPFSINEDVFEVLQVTQNTNPPYDYRVSAREISTQRSFVLNFMINHPGPHSQEEIIKYCIGTYNKAKRDRVL